ncbi:MAG: metallophosphoesterase family protein [Chloroflexi bacterium]|nr:metallophosphoesterase family protein [Chloroflexota bacterium]MBM4454413.1 metallophosphoesterase family protein [Chloroflexota bacterium]
MGRAGGRKSEGGERPLVRPTDWNMKIGVLSDTHVHTIEELSPQILSAFSGVDLIVHCGDFVGSAVLEGLKRLGEVKAVRGNVDSSKLKSLLPETEQFTFGGKEIGVIHGWGGPEGMERRVRTAFGDVDVILYGHSHEAKIQKVGGVLFFNPGPGRYSYGILTVDKDVRAEIMKIG